MGRILLAIAIVFTLGVSFVCSLSEAIILSTTIAEIEALKKSRPRRGQVLETLKQGIDETLSAILTLNTVANGLGSVAIGAIGAHLFGEPVLIAITFAFGALLLVGAEVLPKNIGVSKRRTFQPYVVYPIAWLRRMLTPITWLCNFVLRPLIGPPAHLHGSDEEIKLLAERGAQDGSLSPSESNIIANALSLDNVRVSAIMTPRTVITALSRSATVGSVLNDFPNLRFGRMPVYGKNLDDIVGIVRRRDLLAAKARGQDATLVEQLMHEAQFVPETVAVANALSVCLKVHQKLLVAVDEFGATAGVITMEDVFEHLLGREIFEQDDVAIDMRELARSKLRKSARARK
jgi:CBS domain containing-hemolysin-like protein